MPDLARDQFARYYAEKLWDWIPAVYRDVDGQDGPSKHVLRALVEAIAGQAAVARRSIDRLWEDQSIEACDDWAVPLIGQLVGTRMISAFNRRARRVDVARTIHYRRRSGTLHLLDQLFVDIAAWDGAIVESFRTLGRTFHFLDPVPVAEGRYTHTPRGGFADLRRPRGVELTPGPWDELAHTADLRQHRGLDGRHSIRGLNFHLYRMRAYPVFGPTPVALAPNRWTFDPSGRDTPLFMPAVRPQEACHARVEWDIAGPIRCRLLGHAEYQVTAEVLAVMQPLLTAPAFDELSTMLGLRFRDERRLRETFDASPNELSLLNETTFHIFLANALTTDSAKAALVRDARAFKITQFVDPDDLQIPAERTMAGNLSTWDLEPLPGKIVIVDPVRGRFWFPGVVPPGVKVAHYHYGFSGDLGAGAYDRRRSLVTPSDSTFTGGVFTAPVGGGVLTFEDSATYIVDDVSDFTSLVLQAESFTRPYLRRHPDEGHDWVVTPNQEDAELVLDGLWYGGGKLILDGDFKKVTIRHCTLDPGGVRADGAPLLAAGIVVQNGTISELVVESSIIASITLGDGGVVLALALSDAIVHSVVAGDTITLPEAELKIARSTLAIPTSGLRIDATEVLASAPITVTDHQTGCVRFSVLAPLSHTPPIYRGAIAPVYPHWFVSRRFGDPGYFALSETAPASVTRGAENGSEIGAFSSLLNPLKHDGLRTKILEFMPLGRLPAFIRET